MKKLLYLFLALGQMMLTAGCTHTSREPRLVAVDSMLATRPDSAQVLLRQDFRSSFGEAEASSEADRMYYYLLLADACNKCYDTLPSDSIMHLVADFYDAHGTPNEQVRAHYLLGCVYRDLGEAPQALDCYHTALDCADTTASDCNYRLLMSVYGQMADLFHRQNLPQDEIWALEKSGQCDLIRGDTIGYIGSQELMMRAYGIMRDTTKTIETILETQRLYKEHNNIQLSVRTNASLAYILLNRNDIDEAKTLLDDYEIYSGLFEKEGNIVKGYEAYYNIKALFYHKKNQLDSAEYWYRKELRDGKDFNNQNGGALGLAMVFEQRHIPDSAAKYYQYAYAMNDSMYAQMTTETISRTQALYNYSRHQQIADTEARNAERARHYVFVISLCCIVLLVCLYAAYARYKRNKHVEIKHIKEQYESDVEKLEQAKYDLMKMQEKEITHLIEEKAKDICQLQQQIGQYEQALSSTKTVQQLEHHLEANGSYARFRYLSSHPSEKPTEEDWQLLRTMTDELLPDFKTTIYGAAPGLKQADYDICLLVRLYFSPSEVAMLTDNALSAITMKRRRLLERLFHQTGKAETFDRLIRQIR